MSGLARDGTAEPVSRGQNLRRKLRRGKNRFWQQYGVDPYSSLLTVLTKYMLEYPEEDVSNTANLTLNQDFYLFCDSEHPEKHATLVQNFIG